MKSKPFFIAIIAMLMAFLLGWLLRGTTRPADQSISSFADTTSKAGAIRQAGFSQKITGRFLLEKSHCAGFTFLNKDRVLWTNEIACYDPDSLKLRWLNDSIFMTQDIRQITGHCPPKVDLYKVIYFDGRRLTLKNIRTGWGDGKDGISEFFREPATEQN